jgi:ZIP family zinc transporter
VLEAGLWAAAGQSALIVGALLVARFPKLTEPRWLGLVMAFGAGALISAVTTDLIVQAYREAGRAPAGVGLLIGALGYYGFTRWLDRRAEREDPEAPVAEEEAEAEAGVAARPVGADATAARNLTVGMVVDGIPESIAIGLTLLGGASVSFALVGAVFLSNLPQAIGVAAALLAGGIPLGKVLLRFSAIVAVGFAAGLVGYALLDATNADAIAVIQSIAAGAMVVVIVNEMVPIAVRGAGRRAGLAAAAGFALAAFLSTLNA